MSVSTLPIFPQISLGGQKITATKNNILINSLLAQQIPNFPSSQVVEVNQAGNDSVANGTSARPFLTIAAAMNSIMDSAYNKMYTIRVGPGYYTEPGKLFKPWVTIEGISSFNDEDQNEESSANIQVSGASVFTMVDGLNTGDYWEVGMSNVYVASSIDISSSPSSMGIFLNNVQMGASLISNSAPLTNIGVFQNGSFGSAIEASQGEFFTNNCQMQQITFNVASGSMVTFVSQNATIASLSCDTQHSSSSYNIQLFASPSSSVGPWLFNNSGKSTLCSVISDIVSIPSFQNVSLVSGVAYHYISRADSLGYTPENPSKWASPAPITVQAALDRLAAGLITPP